MSGAIQYQFLKRLPSTSLDLGVAALWLMSQIFSFLQDLFSCEAKCLSRTGEMAQWVSLRTYVQFLDCWGSSVC